MTVQIFTRFLPPTSGGGGGMNIHLVLKIVYNQHNQFLKNFVMLSSLAIPTGLFVTQFPFVIDHDHCVVDHAAQLVRMCLSCWWKRRWRRIWSVGQETGDWIEADWPLFTPPPSSHCPHVSWKHFVATCVAQASFIVNTPGWKSLRRPECGKIYALC
jgi:hypothetical protein